MATTAVKSTSTLTITTVRAGKEVEKEVVRDNEQQHNFGKSQG